MVEAAVTAIAEACGDSPAMRAVVDGLVGGLSAGIRTFDGLPHAARSGGLIDGVAGPSAADLGGLPSELATAAAAPSACALTYAWTVRGRQIRLKFVCYGTGACVETVRRHARLMYAWLYYAVPFAPTRCAASLTATIYMLDIPRELPSSPVDVLGPVHLNGGLSYVCARAGAITIYRAEECVKVFIHETFHALGLDEAAREGGASSELIATTFPVPATVYLSEAYAETWATIAYAALLALTDPVSVTASTVAHLAIEQVFAAMQAHKVLAHMGLRASDMWREGEHADTLRRLLYREDTNVFAYFVARAALLAALPRFLEQCAAKNLGPMKLKATASPHLWVAELVAEVAAGEGFEELLAAAATGPTGKLAKTLRMTALAI